MKQYVKSLEDIPGPYSWRTVYKDKNAIITLTTGDFGGDITISSRGHEGYPDVINRMKVAGVNISGTNWHDPSFRGELIVYCVNRIINRFIEEAKDVQ